MSKQYYFCYFFIKNYYIIFNKILHSNYHTYVKQQKTQQEHQILILYISLLKFHTQNQNGAFLLFLAFLLFVAINIVGKIHHLQIHLRNLINFPSLLLCRFLKAFLELINLTPIVKEQLVQPQNCLVFSIYHPIQLIFRLPFLFII